MKIRSSISCSVTSRPSASKRPCSNRLRYSRSTPSRAEAVLLDAQHRPLAEALGVAEVVGEVVPGDHVELVAEHEDDVGLVGERRGAAQVVRAHPRAGTQGLLLGGHDGEDRRRDVDGEVLEALDDRWCCARPRRPGRRAPAPSAGSPPPPCGVAPVASRTSSMRARDRGEVRAAAGRPVDEQQVGVRAHLRERPQGAGDAVEALLDRGGPGVVERLAEGGQPDLVGVVLLAGLHGHQLLDQVLGLVLVGEVEDRPAGARDGAADLQREGRLAEALRPGEEHQRARAQAPADDRVEAAEPGRPQALGGVPSAAHAFLGRGPGSHRWC